MLGCCLSIRWVASDVVVTLILSKRKKGLSPPEPAVHGKARMIPFTSSAFAEE